MHLEVPSLFLLRMARKPASRGLGTARVWASEVGLVGSLGWLVLTVATASTGPGSRRHLEGTLRSDLREWHRLTGFRKGLLSPARLPFAERPRLSPSAADSRVRRRRPINITPYLQDLPPGPLFNRPGRDAEFEAVPFPFCQCVQGTGGGFDESPTWPLRRHRLNWF